MTKIHASTGECTVCAQRNVQHAKQATADMRAAARTLRSNPEKAGVAPQHAEILADLIQAAGEDLSGAVQYVRSNGGYPFELVDEPGAVCKLARLARSVNATTGDPS